MADNRPYMRQVQSFVRREGRLTPAQARALETVLPEWGWPSGCQEPQQVFGRQAETILEIGFGAGENLLAQCQAQPERNFIGLEVHRPGVGQLLHRGADARLTNLRVSSDDALVFLKERVPASSLDQIQIWFPDPWPKKRHHKRRIIQDKNLSVFTQALRPGGQLLMATDWEHYAHWMLEAADAHPALHNDSGAGNFAPRCADRILTRFEARGQRLGHAVFDLAYTRVTGADV